MGTFLLGSGIAFAATPATEAIMAALPAAKQGVASALNDVTRELGGVLGIALLGSVFNTTYRDRMTGTTTQLPSGLADTARDSVSAAMGIATSPGAPPGLLNRVLSSFEAGLANATMIGAIVVAVGAVAGFVLVADRRARAQAR